MQNQDKLTTQENIGVGVNAGLFDKAHLQGIFRLEKYHCDKDGNQIGSPYEVIEFENAITNAGGALVGDLIIGAGGTVFNNANAYLGVGDSTTAFSASHTDLQASTNKLRKAMDATYPSRSSQVVTFKSTFGTSDANFAWEEAAVFNASSAGTMLCRKVQAMGTKASGTSWVLTYTLTIP